MLPALFQLQVADTHRLIPSRYPTVGVFDHVESAEDAWIALSLESLTNDRLQAELQILNIIPPDEWVTARPGASTIMAAFTHVRPGGGRFNDERRGAWYAGLSLDTAIEETIHHRTQEFAEIGVFDSYVEMRQMLAAFDAPFHDIRGNTPDFAPLYDPDDYTSSQRFARDLFESGSRGVIFNSVRQAGGECLACFRPREVLDVRVGIHLEYRWTGTPRPTVRQL